MKICFLSLNAYPTLTERNLGYAGGAEVEQVHLGTELSSLGNDVCFITYGKNFSPIEVNNNRIKIIESYYRDESTKLCAFKKCSSLLCALKKADADLYFHEAGSYGVLPIFSKLSRTKFVHRIASDAVVLSKPINKKLNISENLLTQFELKTAKVIIAQSRFQRETLRERFKLNSVIIKNGLILPSVNSKKPDLPVVLWVGSISRVKNPELFLDLAKHFPDIQFEMIGGRGEPWQLYDEILQKSDNLSNLKFHGFIPYQRINEKFAKASILVNTSSIEGFPNTFLQAWANNVPVVSLKFDPDNLLSNEKLGFCSGSFERLISHINCLLSDKRLRNDMGYRSRLYVEEFHDIKQIGKIYLNLFNEII